LRSRALGSANSASRLTILENDFAMAKRYRLRIPRGIYEKMLLQARAELPNECCGMLAGVISDEGIGLVSHHFPLVNDLASPVFYQSFPFAAHKAIRSENIDPLAIYHSHPTSAPVPSRTDCARNHYGAEIIHLIISLQDARPQMRAWRLSESSFEEAEWECWEES